MNQKDSISLDAKLMSESIGYSLEQLMELAGQGVAMCINDVIEAHKSNPSETSVLLMIGPGNNGGCV